MHITILYINPQPLKIENYMTIVSQDWPSKRIADTTFAVNNIVNLAYTVTYLPWSEFRTALDF